MSNRTFSQKIWEGIFRWFNLPREMSGDPVYRAEPCRMCNSRQGIKISEVAYWDLKKAAIVRCGQCRLMQLDPMLTDADLDIGCKAYHFQELLNAPAKELVRNQFSNFRKGVSFACSLKRKNFSPRHALEFGPGTGYFCAGIQHVFPEVKITVVDIVDDVLERIQRTHGFDAIKGTPESFRNEPGAFDLVIARDIMEHVSDIGRMLSNIERLLTKGGLFHFITPNGHEDVWRFYARYVLSKTPADLRINHVNFFDGEGLGSYLMDKGFFPLEYYTYKIKTTMRGSGWRLREKNAADPAGAVSARDLVARQPENDLPLVLCKNSTLGHWLLNERFSGLFPLYSSIKTRQLIKLHPCHNIGHELYGLFQKN